MERRLAAILAADVVGYSRLMGANEVGTLKALREIRTGLVEGAIATQHGRIVKLTGDGILAEFPSVVNALQSAMDIQSAMQTKNTAVPEDRQIQFRIGINLGDIIIEDDDIFGDGVNIAARLETVARPGGIAVSGSVRDQIGTKLDVPFESAGMQRLKNIETPVSIFHINAATRPNRVGATPVDPPARPSIAVLPFANMSGDPEQEYFAEGITEDLITDLSKLKGLFVVGRNSAFVYKGKPVNLQDAARELGVRHILEGSVRTSGQRVRITGQLIDGLDGGHVWAERYDRDMDDIFALQDEITRAIVEQLEVRLLDTERPAPGPAHPGNIESYNLYLKGRQLYHLRNRSCLNQARACFLEALRHDPDYARAYVGLADCEARLNDWHGGTYPVKDIQAMARRALELAPDMAEAHAAMALALQISGCDDAAANAYRKALDLDPLCYEAHHNVARFYRSQKDNERAAYHFTRALEIDPDDYRSPLLLEIILRELDRRDDRDQYLQMGLKRAQAAVRLNPDNPDPLELGASVLASSGDHAQARVWLDRALALDPDRQVTNGYNVACTYALIGETETALDWLERIFADLGRAQDQWMRSDPDFDSLRDHPRFQRLFSDPR